MVSVQDTKIHEDTRRYTVEVITDRNTGSFAHCLAGLQRCTNSQLECDSGLWPTDRAKIRYDKCTSSLLWLVSKIIKKLQTNLQNLIFDESLMWLLDWYSGSPKTWTRHELLGAWSGQRTTFLETTKGVAYLQLCLWCRARMGEIFENAVVSAHEFPSEGASSRRVALGLLINRPWINVHGIPFFRGMTILFPAILMFNHF